MKYSVVVMLFLGAISTTEAINLTQKNSIAIDLSAEPTKIQLSQKNPTDLKAKVDEKKVEKKTSPVKASEKPPKETSHIQTKSGDNMVVSIEAVKKPEGANKAEELAAMEEALKKATEEAHKQRIAITGEESTGVSSIVQSGSLLANKALQELKSKQEAQQRMLIEQLANEEKQRENELKQNIELEAKIAAAEKERQNEEVLAKERSIELKKLQEEEATQKLEAEKKEQEFLAAQAVQETKAAAAKKAAAKANLARMKRKHELQRRKAEAQLQMLKVKQQMEAETAIDNEKANSFKIDEDEISTSKAAAEALVQQKSKEKENLAAEAKAKAEAEAKAKAEAEVAKKAKEEAEKKEKEEAEKKAAAKEKAEKAAEEKKAAEAKAKAEADKKAKEEAAKKAAFEKKRDEKKSLFQKKMDQEVDSFSVTLNKKHFDEAIKIKEKMVKEGFEEPKLKVDTLGIYKKSFTFPQIANNDYAIEQFETLAIAEANLNNDLGNNDTYEAFIGQANSIAHNLTERYKEQWVDPKDDRE